jgi:hypothetical protein
MIFECSGVEATEAERIDRPGIAVTFVSRARAREKPGRELAVGACSSLRGTLFGEPGE